MEVLGLVIAAIIAALVARDAKRRGMAPVVWFFGVFLLLIVVLPIYFIVRKPLLPQYQPQLAQPTLLSSSNRVLTMLPMTSLCPHCGKYYAANANFCPLCGKAPSAAA
jgi:zinc-ribbon domain